MKWNVMEEKLNMAVFMCSLGGPGPRGGSFSDSVNVLSTKY